jgi:hypothetical protein
MYTLFILHVEVCPFFGPLCILLAKLLLTLHLVAVEQKRVESQGVMYYSVHTTPLSTHDLNIFLPRLQAYQGSQVGMDHMFTKKGA